MTDSQNHRIINVLKTIYLLKLPFAEDIGVVKFELNATKASEVIEQNL